MGETSSTATSRPATVLDPLRAIGKVMNAPVGVRGRYRPFCGLNLLDRRRKRSLDSAVQDRLVVVTGASSGIGEETARRVAAAGGHVALVARRGEVLEGVKGGIEQAGGVAHVHPADLSDLDDVQRLASELVDRHGGVDVLVNNAGRSIRRSVTASYDRMHDYQRTMQLNYFGPVQLILGLLPSMVERERGHIINVSSAGVQAGAPRFSAYLASKAALDAFSHVVAAEVRSHGIQFTTVYMPLVRTPMIAPTSAYDRIPVLTPAEAGDLMCEAITFKPHHVSSVASTAMGLSHTAAPWLMDGLRSAAYSMVPESDAAAGDEAGSDEGGSPAVRDLMNRFFPGVLG